MALLFCDVILSTKHFRCQSSCLISYGFYGMRELECEGSGEEAVLAQRLERWECFWAMMEPGLTEERVRQGADRVDRELTSWAT